MPAPADPAKLRKEAAILSHLLRMLRDDWRFRTTYSDARVVYFIDGHDLDSYIAPDKAETLNGFLFEAELAATTPPSIADFRLKSDQILHRLLFDGDKQVGLLPSHADEIDDQITYYSGQYAAQKLSLLVEAKKQYQKLRRSPLLQLLSRENLGAGATAEARRTCLELLEARAPALLVLLRKVPDNSRARIDGLVERSDLATMGHFGWEQLGCSREEAQTLRALRASESHIDRWHRFIESRDERRDRSTNANRIDAEAMACMDLLREQLRRLKKDHIRVVLVTRVMSLVRATRDAADLEARGLNDAGFLRHPRMLLLPGTDPQLSAELIETLAVALDTFESHLEALSDAHARAPGAPDEALADAMEKARQIFVTALHDFERATFTLDLRVEAGHQTQPSQDDIDRILVWFANDVAFEKVIREEARSCVQRFGYDTYALERAGGREPIEAIIEQLEGPARTSVRPLVCGAPGPVQFSSVLLRKEKSGNCEDLEKLLGDLEGKAAERYLAWALLHASRARWDLARIYARSAADLAQLLPSQGDAVVLSEANLLLAQIRRLGGLDARADTVLAARRRLDAVRKLLLHPKPGVEDVRLLLEFAAQILEFVLVVREEEPSTRSRLTEGLSLLQAPLKRSTATQDFLGAARSLAMRLAYALVAIRRGLPWPEGADPVPDARRWHRELRDVMQRVRQDLSPDEIPRRVFAMEIVGFMLLREGTSPEGFAHSQMTALIGHRREALADVIPEPLRYFARELHLQLKVTRDQIGKLIAAELEALVGHQNEYLRWEVIFAPIWSSAYGDSAIAADIVDSAARKAAGAGFRILSAVAAPTQLGVDPAHRRAFRRAADWFDKALARLRELQHPIPSAGDFYVRMEACYALLLHALVVADPAERAQHFRSLIERYERLSRDYPTSAIIHFRLHVVYDELQPAKEGFSEDSARELLRAQELLDQDTVMLGAPGHWVRSTICRRRAVSAFSAIRRLRQEIREHPADATALREYLEAITAAFGIVYTDFPFDRDLPAVSKDDLFMKLEAERRINNVVYTAARFLEVETDLARLHPQFTQAELLRLTERLHPEGIENMRGDSIVHTVGCAYRVLGKPELADKAGKHLMQLLYNQGLSLSPGALGMVEDALQWSRDMELPLQSAAH